MLCSVTNFGLMTSTSALVLHSALRPADVQLTLRHTRIWQGGLREESKRNMLRDAGHTDIDTPSSSRSPSDQQRCCALEALSERGWKAWLRVIGDPRSRS